MKKPECSFCGRSQEEVGGKLFSGMNGAFICKDCIEACYDMLDYSLAEEKIREGSSYDEIETELLTPKEIKAKLDEYVIGQD